MKSPFGLAYGLGQMGAGVTQGLVLADHENRARLLQDRAYGLQQAQGAREQSFSDQRTSDWERNRMLQDQGIQVSALPTPMVFGPMSFTVPEPELPEGHPDAMPQDESKSAMPAVDGPTTGLVALRHPARTAAPTPAQGAVAGLTVRPPMRGDERIREKERTGKANSGPTPDELLASANAAMASAKANHDRIEQEMQKSGLNPSSAEGMSYRAALERRFGTARDAYLQQASKLRDDADMARYKDFGRKGFFYLKSKGLEAASPYLRAVGIDPSTITVKKNKAGDPEIWLGDTHLTDEVLRALTDPGSWSPEMEQEAWKHLGEIRKSEMEAQARIREASIRAAGERYDPVLARMEKIAELDRAYQMLPEGDPRRKIIANQVHNLRAMTGIVAAEARDKTSDTGEWKAQDASSRDRERIRLQGLLLGGDMVSQPEDLTNRPKVGDVGPTTGKPLPPAVKAKVDAARKMGHTEETIKKALIEDGF